MGAEHTSTTFGTWLKEYRRAHDLTRIELGRRVGCSPETIHKIETGERRPSRQIAELLADSLQVVPDRRASFVEFARGTMESAPQTLRAVTASEERQSQDQSNLTSGLTSEAPAYAPPTNLSRPLTRLIGRQNELCDIRNFILGGTRLLTLTGPPGIGKTRIGLQSGLELLTLFPHGVFFVPLAAVREADSIMEAVHKALDIEEANSEEPLQLVIEYLKDKRLVLILDNCEQIVGAGLPIVTLLESCPDVRAIVTSREPLHTRGEQRYQIPPLAVAGKEQITTEKALELSSVMLFVERARDVRPGFTLTGENAPVIAAICAQVEGVPLSIELLAAHMKMLSPQSLLERIARGRGKQQLEMLGGGPVDLPDRHRSLSDAIAWSFELLDERERKLFARFSVFVGGCTLTAAEAVCDLNGDLGQGTFSLISSLLDKNLIKEERTTEGPCEMRFTMLEAIRQYAAERLRDSGEIDTVARWCAEYFLALAVTADPQLGGADQELWFSRLECDHDNLRAALEWTIEHGEAEMAGRLATALVIFWDVHGHVTEGRRWLEAILAKFDDRLPALVKADVLKGAGSLAEAQGDLERAVMLITQSLEIRTQAGDHAGMASSLTNLSLAYMDQGEFDRASQLLEEGLALYRRLEDLSGVAAALSNLGLVELYRERYECAIEMFEESLALKREIGDALGCATALCNLGEAARRQGNYIEAKRFIGQALELANLEHKELVLACIGGLAVIAVRLMQPVRAACIFGAEAALRETLAMPLPLADQEEYEHYLDEARAMADESTFQSAWAQGRAMDIRQIQAYVLEDN